MRNVLFTVLTAAWPDSRVPFVRAVLAAPVGCEVCVAREPLFDPLSGRPLVFGVLLVLLVKLRWLSGAVDFVVLWPRALVSLVRVHEV